MAEVARSEDCLAVIIWVIVFRKHTRSEPEFRGHEPAAAGMRQVVSNGLWFSSLHTTAGRLKRSATIKIANVTKGLTTFPRRSTINTMTSVHTLKSGKCYGLSSSRRQIDHVSSTVISYTLTGFHVSTIGVAQCHGVGEGAALKWQH